MIMTRKKSLAGFTLIEVILSMAITAFIAVIAYSALSVAISTSEQHEQKAQQLADIQLALSVLERDIRNSVARGIKDEFSDQQAAMMGGALADYVLQLTRRGWDNPTEIKRGDLQRVRYEFNDNTLWRQHWLVLDRVNEGNERLRVMVIENVTAFEILFLKPDSNTANPSSLGGVWQDEWDDNDMPLAIEVRLDIEHFGEVKRVFEITSP
jgi:general secretion pathway protein J